MASPMRSLRNLRTLSGRVDQMSVPYRAYMQVTCLEMEKARREAERRSAGQRITEIDARLQEIEAEKADILKRLSEAEAAGTGQPKARSAVSPERHRRGVMIRY